MAILFKLEKPNIKRIDSKNIVQLLEDPEMNSSIAKCFFPEYLYWDRAKYKNLSKRWSSETFWAALKFLRSKMMGRLQSVIIDEKGKKFSWIASLPWFNEFFHEIDMNLGGALLIKAQDLDEKLKRQFVTRGIMEEAIASSQLEGANTTRKIAKRMIGEGRRPKTIGEKMILNNYRAMLYIEDASKNCSLDMELLKELHAIITKGTLEDERDEGRFRTDKDQIVVHNDVDNTIYHIAPKEKFMKKEISRFIEYANDNLRDDNFMHPVAKAILLHFWIGYLHPFIDGNGRLARSIFYWYLFKHGYWGFSYFPLSKIIKDSSSQYKMSYTYTEQDDNDLTYFLDYNIRKIKQAMDEFCKYEKRIQLENKEMIKIVRTKYDFNDRQINLLRFYYKNQGEGVSIASHMQINEISRITAIKDLHQLKELDFIYVKRLGRRNYYYASEKVKNLFMKD